MSKLPQGQENESDQLRLLLVLNLISRESSLSVLEQSQQSKVEIWIVKLESGTC